MGSSCEGASWLTQPISAKFRTMRYHDAGRSDRWDADSRIRGGARIDPAALKPAKCLNFPTMRGVVRFIFG